MGGGGEGGGGAAGRRAGDGHSPAVSSEPIKGEYTRRKVKKWKLMVNVLNQ